MTHATIRFQYDTARFELYLDKLTGLPAPISHTSLRKAKRRGGRHPLIFKTVGGLCRTSRAKRAVPSWPKTTGSIKP